MLIDVNPDGVDLVDIDPPVAASSRK